VIVNESEAQILSLGADKVVKVWDFRSNRCIQTLSDSSVNTPTITALFQNPETRSLVAGGMALQQWTQKKAKEVLPSQVCTALYNPNFRQVRSCLHRTQVMRKT
jgi:WD40 repeat protein